MIPIRSFLLCACCTLTLPAAEWHVDAGADAGGDGSASQPFTTIQAAADRAEAGDTVLIHAGVYREMVRPANDGSAGAPIVFTSAPGERATVSGYEVLAGPWQNEGGQVFAIDLDDTEVAPTYATTINQAEQILVDGRWYQRARLPTIPTANANPLDGGWLLLDEVVSVTDGKTSSSDDIPDWAARMTLRDDKLAAQGVSAAGAQLFLKPWQHQGHGWGFLQSGIVESHNAGENTFTVLISRNDKYEGGAIYYLAGTDPLLDAAGEWVRRSGNELALQLPSGSTPDAHVIEIKRRDFVFDLDQRAHITVRDLDIVGASITTDRDAGNKGKGNGATPVGRSSRHGWDVAPSHHIVLEGLHCRFINHFEDCSGGDNWQWAQTTGLIVSGTAHVIRDCDIGYSAGNGIVAMGYDIEVRNNVVHNMNYMLQLSAGISTGHEFYSEGITIARNTVYRCGFDAITTQHLRTTNERPSRVHHNRVAAFGLWTEDVGGIKSVGHDEQINGTRYDHNMISDGGDWSIGLYQDYSTGFVLDNNWVWDVRVGCNVNDGVDHQVYHNTLWSSADHPSISGQVDNIDTRGNLLRTLSTPFSGTGSGTFADNIEHADATWLMDPSTGDLRLRSGTPPVDAGQAIAPYTDGVNGAPDIGAHEAGTTMWTTGSSLPLPGAAPPVNLTALRQANGSVRLGWSDRADDERHYLVERSHASLRGRHWSVVAELAANTTTWHDTTDATADRVLYYRVRADDSLYSNTATVLTDLGGRWRCEDDLKDTAATDVLEDDGSLVGGSASFQSDAPEGGQALVLDPDRNQYLQIPDSPEVRISDRFTWTGWVKPTASTSAEVIFAKRAGSGNDGLGVQLAYHHNRMRLVTNGSKGDTFDYQPPRDAWTMMAVTYDIYDRTMRVYATDSANNVQLVHENTNWWDESLASDAPLCFGGHPSQPDRTFPGAMDDLRWYHRVLEAAELQAIVDGTAPTTPAVSVTMGQAAVREDAFAAANHDDGVDLIITRSGAITHPLAVHYRVASASTASGASDIAALPELVVIPAGQRQVRQRIVVVDDQRNEGDEDLVIALHTDPAYTLGNPATATLRIRDNDGGAPTSSRRIDLQWQRGGSALELQVEAESPDGSDPDRHIGLYDAGWHRLEELLPVSPYRITAAPVMASDG